MENVDVFLDNVDAFVDDGYTTVDDVDAIVDTYNNLNTYNRDAAITVAYCRKTKLENGQGSSHTHQSNNLK